MLEFGFLFFFIIFIFVGLLSVRHKKKNAKDYYLASNSISAPLIGLSAISSLFSGFMFFGYLGFVYKVGALSIIFPVAALISNWFIFKFIVKKFATIVKENKYITYGEIISHSDNKRKNISLLKISSIFIISLLIFILVGQLASGVKALSLISPDISLLMGAGITLFIVMLYSYAGGIRASIWTDSIQSVIMLGVSVLIAIISIQHAGGLSEMFSSLARIDPSLVSFKIQGYFSLTFLNLIGWLLFAIGSIALPYVAVRFMAMKNPNETKKVGSFYLSYMAIFMFSIFFIGLAGRVLIPIETFSDPEMLITALANNYLPHFLVGMTLAGIFAAIISTSDSVLLSASSSASKDLFPKFIGDNYRNIKLTTLVIAILSLIVTFFAPKSIFTIIVMSVSLLASAFVPILAMNLLKIYASEKSKIIMLVGAIIVNIVWRTYGYPHIINEVAIAFLFSILFQVFNFFVINKKVKR